MPSARDKCFAKAVQKLKDGGKLKYLKVQDQQRWVKDYWDQTWSQTGEVWYKVVGAVPRLRKALDLEDPNIPDGAIDGTRIPDMTVTPEGGKPIVIDNKFDGDSFREDQRQDYNEINRQQNGDPKAKNLELNSQVCKSGEPGSMDPVPVPQPAPFMVPGTSPLSPYSAAPSTAGAAAGEAAGAAAPTGGGFFGDPVFGVP